MPRNSADFEQYVRFVHNTLRAAQGRNIAVSRGATVYDNRGNPNEFDLYYEFDVAGVHHRVAIEYRATRRPVERDDVVTFAGRIGDIADTVGVFISTGGFRPAAKKYLDGHGILAFDGEELPRFGSVLVARISPVVFPDESAVGQPFWTLMDFADGRVHGRWVRVPHAEDATRPVFPLFYARSHAALYHRLALAAAPEFRVRGVEQPTLRFLIDSAEHERRDFAIMRPLAVDGEYRFDVEVRTPRVLAREYVADDPDSLFESETRRW